MNMQELKPIKEGKVREIYDNGDTLVMVAPTASAVLT
jgi:phosphoribosylaminoimidazole-succinocarboxamide synthase